MGEVWALAQVDDFECAAQCLPCRVAEQYTDIVIDDVCGFDADGEASVRSVELMPDGEDSECEFPPCVARQYAELVIDEVTMVDASVDSLIDEVSAGSHRVRAGDKCWPGELRRSRAKAAWMREIRAKKIQERKAERLRGGKDSVVNAWDAERLRAGDRVGCLPDGRRMHPNQYNIRALINRAWQQLDGNACSRQSRKGLDNSHKEMEMLAGLSAIGCLAQSEWVSQIWSDIRKKRSCPVIVRSYDATPKTMMFGRLQGDLLPDARYPFFDGHEWKVLSYDEFVHRTHQRFPQKGVCDLLAVGFECCTINPTTERFQYLCPPVILQNGTSSCIYSATEQATVDMMGQASISELCRDVPFALVQEAPDACSANLRNISRQWRISARLRIVFTMLASVVLTRFSVLSTQQKNVASATYTPPS